MIKYITLHIELLAIFILLMLISSCSITKCRYSNGFNIGFGGKTTMANAIKNSQRQKKSIEKLVNHKTDSSIIEYKDQSSVIQAILFGENNEINHQNITSINTKNQNYHRLNSKKIINKFKHRIDTRVVHKATRNLKNPNQKNKFWDVLKFVIFILLAAIIFSLGIYGFVVFILIALWSAMNGFLVTLGLILIALITILLISLLKRLFGYHKNF
ncbi:MAG: hypothetical protein Q8K70_04440 [Bacteroidota bacterium]|nr:hypothetical protein [Bacteroidota bacterium]